MDCSRVCTNNTHLQAHSLFLFLSIFLYSSFFLHRTNQPITNKHWIHHRGIVSHLSSTVYLVFGLRKNFGFKVNKEYEPSFQTFWLDLLSGEGGRGKGEGPLMVLVTLETTHITSTKEPIMLVYEHDDRKNTFSPLT